MIDELEIQRYDKMFRVKSKAFPQMNIIYVETPLDCWKIKITNKQSKKIILYHQNKRGQKNRFHIQGYKETLYQSYHSIYTHKQCLSSINASKNTYRKGMMEQ